MIAKKFGACLALLGIAAHASVTQALSDTSVTYLEAMKTFARGISGRRNAKSRQLLIALATIFSQLLMSPTASADLIVGFFTTHLRRYDETTGEYLGLFADTGNDGGLGLTFGPDGNVYHTDEANGHVIRLDGQTGAPLGVFTTGIAEARNLAFGPSGDLFVGGLFTESIFRVDGTTGENLGIFATAPGLFPEGIAFGPNGDLFVRNGFTGEGQAGAVLRFDGTTGEFLGNFTSGGNLYFMGESGLGFGRDGNLYVSDWGSDSVLRYDGVTGAFIDTFATGASGDLAFGPDGDLYVIGNFDATTFSDGVLRFSGTTGELLSEIRHPPFYFSSNLAFVPRPVPEPSTYALMSITCGLAIMCATRRTAAKRRVRELRSR
jgi:outer membrane protein assembly factor BamB